MRRKQDGPWNQFRLLTRAQHFEQSAAREARVQVIPIAVIHSDGVGAADITLIDLIAQFFVPLEHRHANENSSLAQGASERFERLQILLDAVDEDQL